MFARFAVLTFLAALALFTEAKHHARSPAYIDLASHALHRRTLTGQTIAFSCYGGGGDCECPSDLNGDSGVLINVYPGFQCAYAGGACTWDDKVCLFPDQLQNIRPVMLICPRKHRPVIFRTPPRRIALPRPHAVLLGDAAARRTTIVTPVCSSTSSLGISVPIPEGPAPGITYVCLVF